MQPYDFSSETPRESDQKIIFQKRSRIKGLRTLHLEPRPPKPQRNDLKGSLQGGKQGF
jgi:hypothetical protein